MAASVDHTSGSIFLTPLMELATPNSHTVTQNCTASWTTGHKVHRKCENTWKYWTTFCWEWHSLPRYLRWISSTAWSWWRKWLFPLAGRRSLCLWGTARASPASWAPRLLPPSRPLSVGSAASSDWPRRRPHRSLRGWEDELVAISGWMPLSPVNCWLIVKHLMQLLTALTPNYSLFVKTLGYRRFNTTRREKRFSFNCKSFCFFFLHKRANT